VAPIVNYAQAINDLAHEISDTAEGKGFWDYDGIGDVGLIPVKLVLIASEVSEALAEHRTEFDDDDEDVQTGMTPMQEDKFTEELADIIIRTLDIAGYFDLDIGNIVLEKMEKNRSRPYRHGKRY
jgi:NTP pyrophosphatase (non-canonical NTP hydrolase)